jgi:hypothetical protein
MSRVFRGKEQERPTWEYPAKGFRKNGAAATNLDILEMLESIRNVLEEVRDRLPQRRQRARLRDGDKIVLQSEKPTGRELLNS